MKKIFIIFLLFLAGCAGAQKVSHEQSMSVSKVIEVPGSSREQIFKNTHDWATRYVTLENADSKSGVIVARGEVGYPSPSVDRIEYTLVFIMRSEFQDNKEMVTFDRIMLKSPIEFLSPESYEGKTYTGGEESPIVRKKDLEAANYVINYITDNLQSYLLARH